jgi:thioredoxin 1
MVCGIVLFSCIDKEIEAQASGCEDSERSSKAELSKGCTGCPSAKTQKVALTDQSQVNEKPLITFVELGSVKCIPCKKMQPVMKAIEEKYGEQIEIIFYDVWKPEQRKYGTEYGIRMIPTQIFLDKDGKEIFRHEGFLPEELIDRFLKEQGLSTKEKS